uniref:Alpha-amylase_C domain-containing protein n=1 Tax=Caenorhabditis japonica TaxID=281687 RepID=A0A8R1I6G7_CAEJA
MGGASLSPNIDSNNFPFLSYRIALNSDNADFGGHSRVDNATRFHTSDDGFAGRRCRLQVYIPCRTALVLEKEE